MVHKLVSQPYAMLALALTLRIQRNKHVHEPLKPSCNFAVCIWVRT